jgi:cytochrome c553
VSGWMRAALCGAALAAAATAFPSSAADMPPPIPRLSPQPPLRDPPSTTAPSDPTFSVAMDQDTDSNPSKARAAIDYVYLCADCHGAGGGGNAAIGVPQLAGRPARDLKQRLAQLSAHHGATGWPDHARVLGQLSQEDIEAIADYLATLVPPPPIATH